VKRLPPFLDSWVGYYDNVINKEDCDSLIAYPWDWTPSKYENNSGVSSNSEDRVKMDECWCVSKNTSYKLLKESTIKVMKQYAKDHEHFSCIHHTDFRLNRYRKGGFMSKHCDNIHHSHGQQYGYPQATVLLFLNNDYEGGDFYISNINYRKPKVGSGLIFPSNFMFPHEVKEVTRGERWSIVTWLM